MTDRYKPLREATQSALLQGPGETAPELRQEAARGQVCGELAPLVGKIHREPWSISDEDWAPARAKYDQDQLFELVVSAAYGAALYRLEAALTALEQA